MMKMSKRTTRCPARNEPRRDRRAGCSERIYTSMLIYVVATLSLFAFLIDC